MWESSHCSLVSRAFHRPLQRDPAGITMEQSQCQLLPSKGQIQGFAVFCTSSCAHPEPPGLWDPVPAPQPPLAVH